MPAADAKLLKRADLDRIAYIRPTLSEQKAPAWTCEGCGRRGNHACRLECRCGHRPGKSHTDKAWLAHKKAIAVPQSGSGSASGRNGNGSDRSTAPWARGKCNGGGPDTASQVAKLQDELKKAIEEIERQKSTSVTLETLRALADASGNIKGEALLRHTEPQAAEGKPPRKPPRHSIEADRRTKKAQTKLDKAVASKTELDEQIKVLEAQRSEIDEKITEATAELETAKREQREQHMEQLRNDDGVLCVIPAGLEEDDGYMQARKRFEDEVRQLQTANAAKKKVEEEERARAAEDTAMDAEEPFAATAAAAAGAAAGPQPGTFTLEELVAAGFVKQEDAKRVADTVLNQRDEKRARSG